MPGSHQKLKEARNRLFSRAPTGDASLPTPLFWPSETDFGFLTSRNMREWISFVSSSVAKHTPPNPQVLESYNLGCLISHLSRNKCLTQFPHLKIRISNIYFTEVL
jgi:hypothetical protein